MDTQSMALSGNERKLMGTLCLLIIFGNINMTMFNLSIPSISADFALTSSQVSWVMVGYSILMAIGAGTYGKLTESFSFRQLYVIGLILLAFGSMIGFFAASYLQVIIGRLLQAAGASSISPLSYAAVTLYFKPTVKGRVLGTLSATIAFASGFGPVFGGFVEQYFGWRALFIVSSLSLFVIPLIFKYVPDKKHGRGSFDFLGAVLFSAGLALVLLGVTNYWFMLIAGAAVLLWFGTHIQKKEHPFIDASFMKNAPYRRILGIGFLTFVCNTGLTFTLPVMMKNSFHLPTSKIGLLMLPGAACAALLGSRIGGWTDRFGSSRVLVISQSLVISGFILLGVSVHLPPWIDALLIIILMIGFNGVLTSSSNLVSTTLRSAELGVGMGIFTLAYLLGGAFGPALVGRLIDLNMPFSVVYFTISLLAILTYLFARKSNPSGSYGN